MKRIIWLGFLLLASSSAFCRQGGTNPPLNIRTENGSVSAYPYQAKFTNGTVTDNADGTVSISVSGSALLSTTSTWTAPQTFSSFTVISPTASNTYSVIIGTSSTPSGTNYHLAISTMGAVALKGTTAGDNAAVGDYGQYISSVSVGLTNFPTSTQYGDLLSMSLTPGDWDVAVVLYQAAETGVTRAFAGISTTTGNNSAGLVLGDSLMEFNPAPATNNTATSIPAFRMSLAATTTVYLKFNATYSANIPQARGRLSARRVR